EKEWHGSSTKAQSSYQFIVSVLLALLPLKYHNSSASPFDTHGTIILFFVITECVYARSLREMTQSIPNTHYFNLAVLIYHASEELAPAFLLLILFPPFGWLVLVSIAIQFVWELYGLFQKVFINTPPQAEESSSQNIDYSCNSMEQTGGHGPESLQQVSHSLHQAKTSPQEDTGEQNGWAPYMLRTTQKSNIKDESVGYLLSERGVRVEEECPS
ncbi:hypothetical protein I3842_13G032100, partial [Carya illinoinensis]